MSETVKGLLLIDGPNAAGKSFLANTIQQLYPGTKIVHCTYRFGKIMWHYHLAALRRCLRHAESGLVVLDRSWMSEEIYAHVYRDGTAWPQEGRIMQKLLLKHAVISVVCILDRQSATDQVLKHRQVGYHSPQFVAKPAVVAERYWQLWHGAEKSGAVPITYVDSIIETGGFKKSSFSAKYEIGKEGRDVKGFISSAIEMMLRRRESQYQPALEFNIRNVAGHLQTAKWLLVGDTVNHPDYKRCWPFMIHANSTLFMAQAMNTLGCSEEEFMWTNVDCAEGHLEKLLALKPGLKVVALGLKAESTLNKMGITHTLVPHPSYGKRFMNQLDWAAEFKAALSA